MPRMAPSAAHPVPQSLAGLVGHRYRDETPLRSRRADLAPSRRSVLIRPPGRTGISDGATTMKSLPIARTCQWSVYQVGPATATEMDAL